MMRRCRCSSNRLTASKMSMRRSSHHRLAGGTVSPTQSEITRYATQIRQERALSKRRLKAGHESLEEALAQRCWANAQVLEVVGYAAVAAWMFEATARYVPKTAGQIALSLCAGLGVGHFTRVCQLSDERRFALLEAWDELYRNSPANSAGVLLTSRTPSPHSASAAS